MEDEKKKRFLEALGNVVEKNKPAQPYTGPGSDLKSKNLAKGSLDKDVMPVEGGKIGRDVTPEKVRVGGGNPAIDTKQIEKRTDISDFSKMQKELDLKQKLKSSFKAAAEAGDEQMMDKLRMVAKKFAKGATTGLKSIPVVGAAVGLMGAEDASAAIPVLDAAEGVGMSAADENQMIAETMGRVNYDKSQARKDRQAALAKLAKLDK